MRCSARSRHTPNHVLLADPALPPAGCHVHGDGATEISALCTHPDHRGNGCARRLVADLPREILARDEMAFLHLGLTNRAAAAAYTALGFRTERVIAVQVFMFRPPRS